MITSVNAGNGVLTADLSCLRQAVREVASKPMVRFIAKETKFDDDPLDLRTIFAWQTIACLVGLYDRDIEGVQHVDYR